MCSNQSGDGEKRRGGDAAWNRGLDDHHKNGGETRYPWGRTILTRDGTFFYFRFFFPTNFWRSKRLGKWSPPLVSPEHLLHNSVTNPAWLLLPTPLPTKKSPILLRGKESSSTSSSLSTLSQTLGPPQDPKPVNCRYCWKEGEATFLERHLLSPSNVVSVVRQKKPIDSLGLVSVSSPGCWW